MHLSIDWLNAAALGWWNYIVHASWQAAVVGIMLLAVVNLAGQRWPAPLRYALLVVALLKFACPPLLPFPTGLFSQLVPAEISALSKPERKPMLATVPRGTAEAAVLGASGPAPRSRLTGESGGGSGAGLRSAKWLMIVHLTGIGLVGGLIVRRAIRLRRLSRACRTRLGSGLREQYRDLAIAMGVYRIPSLGISAQVEAPMAFSVPKPAIVLPTKIVGNLSASELKAVLAHELAHCHRGDLWLNWVQLIILALWWFHPIVWLVNRSIRDIREDCCDDLLLARRIVNNDDYCEVLLRAATQLCPSLPLNAALALTERLHPLARRMTRITDWTLRRSESVSGAGAAVVLLAAALLLPGRRTSEAVSRLAFASEPATAAGQAVACQPVMLAGLRPGLRPSAAKPSARRAVRPSAPPAAFLLSPSAQGRHRPPPAIGRTAM
ncbi:MAG: M56 family metallopeptidase [Verrucomicrobiota bacterium]